MKKILIFGLSIFLLTSCDINKNSIAEENGLLKIQIEKLTSERDVLQKKVGDYGLKELGQNIENMTSKKLNCGIKWNDGKKTNENYTCESIISLINERDSFKTKIDCGIKYGDGTITNYGYTCDNIISILNERDGLKNRVITNTNNNVNNGKQSQVSQELDKALLKKIDKEKYDQIFSQGDY